ncbi:MAG: cellulase family glycosylhydrolase [Planctomycetia bacterium]|nr:cellulase family glycosylhydrolase [Planctomycetia bacterium]
MSFIKNKLRSITTAIVAASLAMTTAGLLPAQEEKLFPFQENVADLFPFRIVHGLPDNITNVRSWQAGSTAGDHGMLRVDGERFVNDQGEVRLIGTNLCFTAAFPQKDKAAAEAEALARFGINVVRLHHMDNSYIWGVNHSRTQTEIDPERLDRLDYFIHQLQKNGIYVNINLHVSRQLDERDGFAADPNMPQFNKGIDNYDQRMIELQKKYAKDFLTHVNPYTGKKYIDDPGIGAIEVNNENSIVAVWKWQSLDYIGSPYRDDLQRLWNDWLKRKYETSDKVRAAWGSRHEPLGAELMPEGNFTTEFAEQGYPNWAWETDEGVEATRELVDPAPDSNASGKVMKFVVTKKGPISWRPQFYRTNISVVEDKMYTLTMKVRGPENETFQAYLAQNHPEWITLSNRSCQEKLNGGWQTFTATFIASATDENTRLGFGGLALGTWEIADVSLREGGDLDPLAGARLEDGTIALPQRYTMLCYVSLPTVCQDWFAFLHDVENSYWDEMRLYIKDELKAEPPLAGTQLNYGFRDPQARYDYCDNHFYWHHPHFPHTSWDGNDWIIGQTAMVNVLNQRHVAAGTLPGDRVLGRPYTISEYDHPYPNPYAAEGNLLFALQGARQGWNGLYQFAWSHSDFWDSDSVRKFFDMCSNQVKLVHMPACWAMFVRGDVPAAPSDTIVGPVFDRGQEEEFHTRSTLELSETLVPKISILDILATKAGTLLPFEENVPDLAGVTRIMATETDDAEPPVRLECKDAGLLWNGELKDKAYLTIDRPGLRLFTGFIADREFQFDAFDLAFGRTWLDWATVSITAMAPPADATTERLAPGRYLIAATGWMQNSDAKLVQFSPDQVTMAKNYQGNEGVAPLLCEGIPMTLTLKSTEASTCELYPLDEAGNRREAIAANDKDGRLQFEFGPQYKTLWYELVVK